MNKETGGPAFPQQGLDPWKNPHQMAEGMTLRDYFAAKAMPSLIETFAFGDADPIEYADGIAKGCYQIADAMLKARES